MTKPNRSRLINHRLTSDFEIMLKYVQRVAGLLFVLALAWLLWSGIFKPLLLGLGVLSCFLAIFLARRIGYFSETVFPIHLVRRLPGYWFWLIQEIFKSSLEVARIVLNPKMPIDPKVVEFKVLSTENNGQAILGNAITLTPGTVTLGISEGVITVHCLSEEGARELLAGEMNRRTAALSGD